MNEPNDCGCCEGAAITTPENESNPPGQPALRVRAGTHAAFKASMLAGIGGEDALAKLTTREDDDPTVGIVDAWASALDVLTFYSERIANEGYLRTATERRSILELARAIGYELGPGVAAGTWLAFVVETLPGAPESVRIPVGVRAQSIPGQDEKPQTFETVEEIEARPGWNALRPRLTRAVAPFFGQAGQWLKGTATGLKVGDALLFVGDERSNSAGSENWDFRRVQSLTVDAPGERTFVTWTPGLGSLSPVRVEPARKNPRIYALRTRAAVFGHNAPDPATILSPAEIKLQFATAQFVPAAALPAQLAVRPAATGLAQGDVLAQAAGQAALVGASVGASSQVPPTADSPFPAGATRVNLDATYPQIVTGSWVVIASPLYAEVYSVKAVAEESVARYNLAGKTTLLTLEGEHLGGTVRFVNAAGLEVSTHFTPRNATVYAQSEELAYAEWDIEEPVTGASIELEAAVGGLAPGRLVAFQGKDAASGAAVAEVVRLAADQPQGSVKTLKLATALAHAYVRKSLSINANVASATHGETRREVLGSGSGAQASQAFALKSPPLTYVSSPEGAGGTASTLEVRVGGVRWHEVPSFFGRGPKESVYTVSRSDEGKATVRFGDGVNGARLPTGLENIAATYRTGIGKTGMVKAGQVSLLIDRLLGLKEVVNPTAPEGAEDPETRDRARVNAPLTVLTLERIVSLQDFEDFARAFAGFAKARATWLWDGQQRVVHLSVAAEDGKPLEPGGSLFRNLRKAIDAARDPHQPVRVGEFTARPCRLRAKVKVHPDYLPEAVLGALADRLAAALSFEARDLGQALAASEVIALAQGVEGVVAVDLDTLDFVPGNALKPRLPARLAWLQAGVTQGAELLTVVPKEMVLTVMTE